MHIDLVPPEPGSQIDLFLLTPEHVTADYVAWLNDRDVNQYLESRFAMHTLESTRQFVATMLASAENLFLGIRYPMGGSPALGRHVGNIKLGPIDRQSDRGEIGILIGDRNSWGKGVATLAISRIASIARNQLRLRRLTAGCYGSNIGSRKAFEKAGFIIDAVLEQQGIVNGMAEDAILLVRDLR